MYGIEPGIKLWWKNRFAVVDYFRKEYGEPVKFLRIKKNQLVVVLTLSGKEERFSKSYFKLSP